MNKYVVDAPNTWRRIRTVMTGHERRSWRVMDSFDSNERRVSLCHDAPCHAVMACHHRACHGCVAQQCMLLSCFLLFACLQVVMNNKVADCRRYHWSPQRSCLTHATTRRGDVLSTSQHNELRVVYGSRQHVSHAGCLRVLAYHFYLTTCCDRSGWTSRRPNQSTPDLRSWFDFLSC